MMPSPQPAMITGAVAVIRAVETLDLAADTADTNPEAAHALVAVADSWRYLAETLDEHPRLAAPR